MKEQLKRGNFDSGGTLEDKVKLAAPSENATWVYYDVAIVSVLDSGIVVHRRLPQVDRAADTLASCDITDTNIDKLTGRGVNLISNDMYTDVIQRMAHSQYWFRLYGQAMRFKEQIPIPGIKSIGGVITVPYGKQVAYNKIVGNYSGVVLWYAEWSLWYTLASPPKKQQAPPQNPALFTDGNSADYMQVPWSLPDDSSRIREDAPRIVG